MYNKKPITEDQIKWADVVIVMDDSQRTEIAKRFPKYYMQKRILSLNIPDIYNYNQPELVQVLKSKINGLF